MVILMARPTKHPATGTFYYRGRVPADLVHQLKGTKVRVTVGDDSAVVTLSGHCKVSLQTKEPADAKSRNAQVEGQLQTIWDAARKGARHLDFDQVCALAGELYRETVSEHEREPGSPADWDFLQGQLSDALEGFERDENGQQVNPKQGEHDVARLTRVDAFLGERGLRLTPQTYRQFVEQAGGALWRAYGLLSRRALGDYSPDKATASFPNWRSGKASEVGVPLLDLFDAWGAETKPSASTLKGWRPYLQDLIRLIGHDDAARLTSVEVSHWKDDLVKRSGAPKTINGSKLAALKTILQWGVDNHRLTLNVASRVRVRHKVRPGEKMKGFSPAEAAALFAAAELETSPVYRWVPALCALTGARVAEVCQLRAEDIRHEAGSWFMHFAPEAGSLKTVNSERFVPLHPYLLESGFLEFTERCSKGPLFYNPERRRPDASKPPAKIVAKNVAAWVHKQGLRVGRAHRKDPNHAWRHYFITVLRDCDGVNDSVIERITGHSASNVNKAYGEAALHTLVKAMNSVPTPTQLAKRLAAPPLAEEGVR